MRRLIIHWLLLFALAAGISIPAAGQASSEATARGPFSETELIKGLAGGMSAKRFVALVGEYGVDFSLTPEIEERLRAVGADDELVESVRKGKAKPLSEADLLRRLASGMENRRLVTLVGQYGVEFCSTPGVEERLRSAGAGDGLIEAIRRAASPSPGISAGLLVHVRMLDGLRSETAQPGDTFRGVLDDPIEANGKTVYPRASAVTGRVRMVITSDHLSRPGELELELVKVESDGKSSALTTEPWRLKGRSYTKRNVAKVGGGAEVGAMIGAIAGGGKGAAIGAAVGAPAGTGMQPAKVESESVMTFTTLSPAGTLCSNRAR